MTTKKMVALRKEIRRMDKRLAELAPTVKKYQRLLMKRYVKLCKLRIAGGTYVSTVYIPQGKL